MIKEETARAQPKASTCEWRHQESYTYDADRMLRTESRPNAAPIVRTPDSAGRLDTVAIAGGVLDYDYYPLGTPSGAGSCGCSAATEISEASPTGRKTARRRNACAPPITASDVFPSPGGPDSRM